MPLELPDGISYNRVDRDPLELELPIDKTTKWHCPECEFGLEALLLTPSGRFEGVIRNISTQAELWQNKLPRDERKAQTMLEENLNKRVVRHREVH